MRLVRWLFFDATSPLTSKTFGEMGSIITPKTSSYAIAVSYADKVESSIFTGSIYPITSSWISNSISSSYVLTASQALNSNGTSGADGTSVTIRKSDTNRNNSYSTVEPFR